MKFSYYFKDAPLIQVALTGKITLLLELYQHTIYYVKWGIERRFVFSAWYQLEVM
jgi:hypothetical protein